MLGESLQWPVGAAALERPAPVNGGAVREPAHGEGVAGAGVQTCAGPCQRRCRAGTGARGGRGRCGGPDLRWPLKAAPSGAPPELTHVRPRTAREMRRGIAVTKSPGATLSDCGPQDRTGRRRATLGDRGPLARTGRRGATLGDCGPLHRTGRRRATLSDCGPLHRTGRHTSRGTAALHAARTGSPQNAASLRRIVAEVLARGGRGSAGAAGGGRWASPDAHLLTAFHLFVANDARLSLAGAFEPRALDFPLLLVALGHVPEGAHRSSGRSGQRARRPARVRVARSAPTHAEALDFTTKAAVRPTRPPAQTRSPPRLFATSKKSLPTIPT